jgi:signal transduction histidine kinase
VTRRDPARLLALLLAAAAGAALLHLRSIGPADASPTGPATAARLDSVARRVEQLSTAARRAARTASEWPEVKDALAGRREALVLAFTRLQQARERDPEAPALALHDAQSEVVAWAGPAGDRRLPGLAAIAAEDVFVVAGNVTTSLVAVVPIRDAGGVRGYVSAELMLAVRRNIRNRFLSDYDRLAGPDSGVEVDYVDVLDASGNGEPLAGPDERLLRGPTGRPLAVVRAGDTALLSASQRLEQNWRRVLSALALFALFAWIIEAPGALRVALGATLVRLALLVLGLPFPRPDSLLVGPDLFASTQLGPLLRSPADLLLTAAWAFLLATLVLVRSLRSLQTPRALVLPALAADLATLPVAGAVFYGIALVSRGSSLALDELSPLPKDVIVAVLQTGLLLWMAAGAALLVSLHARAPLPAALAARAPRFVGWAVLIALAFRFWPRETLGLPLVPAGAFVALSVAAGSLASRWAPRVLPRADRCVLAASAATGLLATLLAPSLAHYGEKGLRAEIEHQLAPLVLRQPAWRRSVLAEAQRRADGFEVLEEAIPGPRPPQLEELAFAVWSGTELAAAGLPSAIEIQDAAGDPVSRFALSLPTPALPTRLPASDEWVVTRDRLPLASAERFALHAQRRLVYHGEIHGAIHVYVADDLLALPVAGTQDPYSVLFRTSTDAPGADAVEMVAWDPRRVLIHSSVDQPPALLPALAERLRLQPAGLWTSLPLDGEVHHVYLFSDDAGVSFALAYPRRSASRYFADVVEASSAGVLLVLAAISLLLLARTLLGSSTFTVPAVVQAVGRRFLLRLFVAFVTVAFLPVVVLQTVVRGFVAERLKRESAAQALSMAAVAKKAVEDFAFFQRGEAPGDQPVTDAALVWVASLVRNDLDVFEAGRLSASSKRELYASSLLPPRVSGTVYRDVVLEGRASALQDERIGALAYRVVSVPLALRAGPPAILSIPLALREREVQAVLSDLDRTTRLVSMLFLVAAALIARTMARRISDPVQELTEATRRVAFGDLGARVLPRSRDELATLMVAFNQMASDLDRQRQDLERSNRLAAWADMARQVAHEVKNPLTPIQLAAEHLRRVFSDGRADFGSTLEACTRTILEQVKNLRGIVTEFSAFARPPATSETADLRQVVDAATRPYAGVLPPGVTLERDVTDVPAVKGDRRLIERAVVNLVENALQAVGERGRVRVSLAASDGYAEIGVEDDGPGLSPDLRVRAFEPFFSTKTGGSGLGLPLVRKIAEDHGGSVTLESVEGRTRATLRLPLPGPSART